MLTRERQTWCNLQVKLCDPCLSTLQVGYLLKYKHSSFPFPFKAWDRPIRLISPGVTKVAAFLSLTVLLLHQVPLTLFKSFLISLVHHHHLALLHCHALILVRLLIFLVSFSTLILKPSFPQSLSLQSDLSLPQADLLNYDHSLFGSHWRW